MFTVFPQTTVFHSHVQMLGPPGSEKSECFVIWLLEISQVNLQLNLVNSFCLGRTVTIRVCVTKPQTITPSPASLWLCLYCKNVTCRIGGPWSGKQLLSIIPCFFSFFFLVCSVYHFSIWVLRVNEWLPPIQFLLRIFGMMHILAGFLRIC